jgi:hypothetical protein
MIAARMLACPIRAMSSRVDAPEPAAKWLPVCRRSWKCSPGAPALATALLHVTWQLPRRGVAPLVPTNTRPSAPSCDHSSGCTRSSGTIASGIATSRRPAVDFGGPSVGQALQHVVVDDVQICVVAKDDIGSDVVEVDRLSSIQSKRRRAIRTEPSPQQRQCRPVCVKSAFRRHDKERLTQICGRQRRRSFSISRRRRRHLGRTRATSFCGGTTLVASVCWVVALFGDVQRACLRLDDGVTVRHQKMGAAV